MERLYGTEQGLHGLGNADTAVREALWGKPNAFNQNQPIFTTLKRLAVVRRDQPALRYGRQYFRPISGDGIHFAISDYLSGVLAFSRILNNEELVVVANTNTQAGWSGEVIVDQMLNPAGTQFEVLFSNLTNAPANPASALVAGKPAGNVRIREVDGSITNGPVTALCVNLQKMEIQILRAHST